MILYTADISDADPAASQMCELDFRNYGRKRVFSGQCVTLRTHEDHRTGVQLYNTPGHGKVLVIDGGGLTHIALLGATMAVRAVANGWAGAIVFGAIRDTDELADIDLGVKALCTTARKSPAPGKSEVDVSVQFGGVTFNPGDWVYADSDAVLVRKTQYVPQAKKVTAEEYKG